LLSLAAGRVVRSRLAGAFLFLPLLARLAFDGLVERAGYPGSALVPAPAALLSLLLLKLLDKERRSHVNDFNFDEALGLFCGLNVLPKKSFLSEYSYRTCGANQRALLEGWVKGLSGLLFPQAGCFSLDFHPIPFRGEDSELEKHYVPLRGRALPSVLTFFALEQSSRVLCYATANLVRTDQAGQVLAFVDFWHGLTGTNPEWLYLDSRVTSYAELSQVDQRDISFVTIRRRGSSVIGRLRRLPASRWQSATIDTPKRRQQKVVYIDESVRLRGYDGCVRQVAVDGLGHEQPTLLLSNNEEETARNLIIRYASRNGVEDGLGQCVNFFHLNCLSSEVRLNVDVDTAMTVVAQGCYRWLGKQLKGHDRSTAKQLFRTFVETGGVVEVLEDRLVVQLDRRCHNPVLREAALDRDAPPIPWLGNRRIYFCYS
jgi:hypothetical protein